LLRAKDFQNSLGFVSGLHSGTKLGSVSVRLGTRSTTANKKPSRDLQVGNDHFEGDCFSYWVLRNRMTIRFRSTLPSPRGERGWG
jgi:hypothetical protein